MCTVTNAAGGSELSAVLAMAASFDDRGAKLEVNATGLLTELLEAVVCIYFADRAASIADQENRNVAVGPMPAGSECLQTLDPVNQAHLQKEIQRPVNGRRFRVPVIL